MKILLFFLLVFTHAGINHPADEDFYDLQTSKRGDYRIMFYNVENLFDTIDNPATKDEEYLPGGMRHWNSYKYWKKIKNTYKTIAVLGGAEPPEIVGFCEIEERSPLEDLCRKTPLSKFNYAVIHQDSQDERGIEVAMIYRKDKLKLLWKKYINIMFPSDTTDKTRDIAYASFVTRTQDTLHVFINHWPSRRGGEAFSEHKRIHAAKILKQHVDAILKNNIQANILIMGDFNDEPNNKSMTEGLSAITYTGINTPGQLYNLSASIIKNKTAPGTHKYQREWGFLDQIIVSSQLLSKGKGLTTSPDDAHVFNARFLMTEDETFTGYKPHRTYHGMKYQAGFSDHLPVFIDLYLN